jgi:hypothetical protein
MRRERPYEEAVMRTAHLLCSGLCTVILAAGCGSGTPSETRSTPSPSVQGTDAPSPPAVTMTITDGTQLTRAVPWQVTVQPAGTDVVQEVDFLIDGTQRWVEREAPYFFDDDEQVLPPWLLGAGSHVLAAHVVMTGGATADVTAQVDVRVEKTSVGKIAGSYHRVVTKADQRRVASYRIESKGAFGNIPPVGRWKIDIKPEGEIVGVDPTGDTTAAFVEPFTLSGSVLMLYGPAVWRQTDPENPSLFCEPELPGRYTWSLSGSMLTINTDQKVCADRDIVMVGTWQRD